MLKKVTWEDLLEKTLVIRRQLNDSVLKEKLELQFNRANMAKDSLDKSISANYLREINEVLGALNDGNYLKVLKDRESYKVFGLIEEFVDDLNTYVKLESALANAPGLRDDSVETVVEEEGSKVRLKERLPNSSKNYEEYESNNVRNRI